MFGEKILAVRSSAGLSHVKERKVSEISIGDETPLKADFCLPCVLIYKSKQRLPSIVDP